ncbi:MAG: hypothetical protein KDA49_01000 [Rhodospirillaceae bacterium]|nr:hypothetical protein [Rhodospirillaceae bacterium]MCA8931012.1 hypothetical protein [Rhodospirillaceae bacterium]
MTTAVIDYTRGSQYVENNSNDGTAHGLVGKLTIRGNTFDTIERMDGYVALDGGRDYPNSVMYWHKRLGCYVVNPWHQKRNKDGDIAEILIHRAEVPSHLKGCIGPGVLSGSRMTKSTEAMATIWKQAGGADGVDKVVVTLRVNGNMKQLSECTKYDPTPTNTYGPTIGGLLDQMPFF